jgi:hypothetical protein
MKTTRGCRLAIVAFGFLAISVAGGQTSPRPALHPFGSAPAQTRSTGMGPTTTPTAAGQPAWLPPKATVPAFPGAALVNDRPPFLAGVKVNHRDLAYHDGDTLSVEFTADREAYLYLIYHQADGKSYLLFPNEAFVANRVPANKWISVPDAGQEFRFRISSPFGTEVLQVLATLAPARELESLVHKTGQAAPVTQKTLDELQQRLKKDPAAWTEHRVSIRTAAKNEKQSPHKAARVGLFVGVNKFETGEEKEEGKNPRFRLGAELMAKVMVERGRLDPQRTKTLVGEQATRDNIEAAITRWLPGVTQPGDTVFIFYGGHGGLVKNLDGTKPDGKDGVLTTYNNAFQSRKLSSDDWDAEARKAWISDGTLARWLQELPGRQIAVIISSCHAGTMIDARLLAKYGSREATRVKGISGLNVAVLVSCFPDEQTLSNATKPVWLAYYLAEAMTRLPGPVTLSRAFEYYRQEHRKRLAQDGDTGFHEPVLTDTALLPIMLAP